MSHVKPHSGLRHAVQAGVLLLALVLGVNAPLSASAAAPTPAPSAPTPRSTPRPSTPKPSTQPTPEQNKRAGQTTHAGPRITVVSPRPNSLVHGDIRVKVRVPKGIRHIRMRVAGRDVSKAVGHHGRFVTARVKRTHLKSGQAALVVWARAGNGVPLFAQVPIVVARRSPGLLSGHVHVVTGGGTAATHLELRTRPTTFSVKLNGHKVPALRRPQAGAVTVPLAADDGLRFGTNTVEVTGYDKKSGRWAKWSKRFQMSKRGPLVSAGPDTRNRLGVPVKLTATGTKWATTSDATQRSYRWRIVRQPRYSKARLLNPTSTQPSLSATRPGVYRVAVEVREGTRVVGTDIVTDEQTPNLMPYGSEISTLVDNGNGTSRTTIQGVPLDNNGDDYIDTPTDQIQVIILDKATLELDSTSQVSGNAATLNAIHSVTSEQIGILVGAKGCCDPAQTIFGLYPANGFTTIFSDGGSTVPILQNAGVALGGAPSGAIGAWVRPAEGGVSGYTVVNTNTAPFDTAVNTTNPATLEVTLGNQTPTFDKTTSQGIVLVSIAPDFATSVFNGTFPLTGGSADQNTLASVASELNDIAQNHPGAVIAFQTWGSPTISSPAGGDVGIALSQFGGTPNLWTGLAQGGDYALVGRAGANASSQLQAIASTEQSSAPGVGTTQTTGVSLRGLLGQGADSLPVVLGSTASPLPTATDQDGNTYTPNPLGLVQLADAAPQPWPAMDGTEAAAYAAISQTIGSPDGVGDPTKPNEGDCYQNTSTWDIRAEYCNTDEDLNWEGIFTTRLNAIDCSQTPAGAGYSAADCAAVQAQLLKEFPMVPTVQAFIDHLSDPFTDAGAWASSKFTISVGNVTNSLNQGVPPPPSTTSVQQFVSDLLQPVQDLDVDPEFTFGAGVLASVLDLSLNQTTTDDGDPALASFTADEDSIGTEALARLEDSKDAIGKLQFLLLTDWTKLSTTNYNVGSIWGQNSDTQSKQENEITASVNSWLYATELPLAYGQIQLAPADGNTVGGVNGFNCTYRLTTGDTWYPFAGAHQFNSDPPVDGHPLQASAVFSLTTSIVGGVPTGPDVLVLGNAINYPVFQTPVASLTDPLFEPIDSDDPTSTTAGLNQAQFYTWAWQGGNRIDMHQFLNPHGPLNHELREAYDGITNPLGPSECTFA